MNIIKIKRVYDEPTQDDGIRILVDRLWPRGIPKERARLDYWMKNIAPNPDLRKWFNHEPEKFEEFTKSYKEELEDRKEETEEILNLLKRDNVTLIYAAKSPTINHAIVLKDFLQSKI